MSTFTNNNVASGDVVRASDHNTQGANIAAVVNGNIENDNINASAAIASSKLAGLNATAFSSWQTWTPTVTGYSTDPTGTTFYYTQVGKTVHLMMASATNGTSNATTKTYSLPVAARTLTNARWTGAAHIVNNGASVGLTLALIQSGDTTLSVFASGAAAAWTASGSARVISCSITYEAA